MTTELLTKAEERSLIAVYQETGNKKALDELVTRNFGIVHKLVHKFPIKNQSVGYDDLFQEGIAGMIHAINKFDSTRGYRLSTYAYRWVWAYMSRYYQNMGRVIRVPVHLSDKHLALRKQVEELTQMLGRSPSQEEIVEMNPNASKIASAMVQPLSLNNVIGDDSELSDLCGYDDTEQNDTSMDVDMMLTKLRGMVSERDFTILLSRYGLGGYEEMTLDEVGKQHGVSRARINQIEKGMINKLRTLV